LLSIADLMVQKCSLAEMMQHLASCLKPVAAFDFLNLSLYEKAAHRMRLHLWPAEHPKAPPTHVSVEESISGWVLQHQEPLIFPEIDTEQTRFPRVVKLLREQGVRSYCMLPLTTARNRLGAIGFGSAQVAAHDHNDIAFLSRIAEMVALSLENANTLETLENERAHLQLLLDVSAILASNLDFVRLFPAISASLRRIFEHDCASVALYDAETETMRSYALDFPEGHGMLAPDAFGPVHDSAAGVAFLERSVKMFTRTQLESFPSPVTRLLLEEGIQSVCCVPLTSPNGPIGTFNLGSRKQGAFNNKDLDVLVQIANLVAVALDNARAYQQIAQLNSRLAMEKIYLEDEIRREQHFEEIVGDSAALRLVLDQVQIVAPSDATVLIQGETGTGKELIARAIHRASRRAEHNFIKVNCAAIPTGLLESELFGHERGAFTGALIQKIGRVELADGGTLFLDEIGDIPLELQPKLLRLLQEHEFERLGSTRTVRVNMRLIAATNRNLEAAVQDRQFRKDLYYRLRVFPIIVPPLRERRSDIPALVRYFTQRFAKRMDRTIETIPSQVLDALVAWDWPGNVRELENLIERSVILSQGPVLCVPLAELRPLSGGTVPPGLSLEAQERELIIRVLRESGGVLAGPRGAAARLGLKRTTLQSKMNRLGITRQDFGN
jgi:formate hydrogenlyase transcriptional activator